MDSPGNLPNNHTVEKSLADNSNIRNPILVSHVAKGLLPYRGLGSGIKRALEAWPRIDFIDDREGSLFTATVRRRVCVPRTGRVERIRSVKSSVKTEEQILALLAEKPGMTIPELAEVLSLSTRAVEKQIANIRKEGRLRRVGPKKGGHWEVMM